MMLHYTIIMLHNFATLTKSFVSSYSEHSLHLDTGNVEMIHSRDVRNFSDVDHAATIQFQCKCTHNCHVSYFFYICCTKFISDSLLMVHYADVASIEPEKVKMLTFGMSSNGWKHHFNFKYIQICKDEYTHLSVLYGT